MDSQQPPGDPVARADRETGGSGGGDGAGLSGDPGWPGGPLAALVVFALVQWVWFRDYRVDDVYIHLTYTRTLLEQGSFAYGNQAVHAASSPLWIFLLAPGLWLFPAHPELVATGTGWLTALLALVLVHRLARSLGASPGGALAACLGTATAPWFAKFAATGMEVGATAAALLATVLSWCGPREGGRGRVWALLAGVCLLLRYETVVVVGLLYLVETFERRRLPLPELLLTGLVVAPWHLFAWWTFGSPLPTTVAIKAAGGGGLAHTLRSLGRSAVLGAVAAGPALGCLALAIRGRRWERRFLVPALGLPLLLLLVGLGGKYMLGRYLAPFTPLVYAVAGASLPARGGSWRWLAGIACLWGLALGWKLNVPWVANYRDLLERSEVRVGRELARWEPREGSVAAFDIGAVGYFSRRPVEDMVGLVTPATIGLDREGLAAYLARVRPAFLLRLEPSHQPTPEDLGAEGELLLENSHGGYRMGSPRPFRFLAYRLRWPGTDEEPGGDRGESSPGGEAAREGVPGGENGD